ncbi:MAG: 50S ribosomal protein L29 [Candidatus Aenigmatarchaeota archaeon]
MVILRSEEIRDMDDDEIMERIEEFKLELSKEGAQVDIGGIPENPGRIKELKRTIARMLTILHERKDEK